MAAMAVSARAFLLSATCVGVLVAAAASAAGQRGFFRRFGQRNPVIRNVPYDGQFTFVRVNYTHWEGGDWYQGLPAWSQATRWPSRT